MPIIFYARCSLSFLGLRLSWRLQSQRAALHDNQYLRSAVRFLWRAFLVCCGACGVGIRFMRVPMCKASDRECALSLFGDAVSAWYVPFQSDHKVMAHTKYISPVAEEDKTLEMTGDLAEAQEAWISRSPAERATLIAWTLEDALEGKKSIFATTRNQSHVSQHEERNKAGPEWANTQAETVPTLAEEAVERGGGNSK
jgi:hypothetical protein